MREPVTSGFGEMVPDAAIVERGICKNGHRWFVGDELKTGDVVIQRKADISVCYYASVVDDGRMPKDWKVGTLSEAREWAKGWLSETGGKLREINQ